MAFLSPHAPLSATSPRAAFQASPAWATNTFEASLQMKRSKSSPTKIWQLHLDGSYDFSKEMPSEDDLGSLCSSSPLTKAQYASEHKSVAVLAPSDDSVRLWAGPMVPPSLVRGSRTVLPKPARPERSVWPHTPAASADEVSLFYEGAVVPPPVKLPKARRSSVESMEMVREKGSLLAPRLQMEETNASNHVGMTFWEQRAQLRGAPLGMSEGDAIQHIVSEDTSSSPSRPIRKCFSDGQLSSSLPPLSPDGRRRSEAELVMMHSLKPRTSELHWETSLVSKPPIAEQALSRPIWPRPMKTPAFLRAQERAQATKWTPEIRGKEKAGKLLEVHSEMRRAGMAKEEPPEVPTKDPHTGCTACIVGVQLKGLNPTPDEIKLREEDEGGSAITRALGSCNDTTETLTNGIYLMKNSSTSVEKFGGLRHPSSLLAIRTLCVLERKLEVLAPYEVAVKHLEFLNSNKRKILAQARDGGDIKQLAGPAWNIKDQIVASTHPGGKPAECDRASWDTFVATFRLPSEHELILLGWGLLQDEAPEWAEMCLDMGESLAAKEAKNPDSCRSPESPAANSTKNMFDFLVGINVDPYRPDMSRCFTMFSATRALAVTRYAEAEAAKDKVNEGKKEKADEALMYATNIHSAIKAAVFWGVDGGVPELKKAKELHIHLRAENVGRFAALTMGTIKDGVSGSAAKVADLIDAAVNEAIEVYEVSIQHPAMQEARTLFLEARSEETRLQRKLQKQKLAGKPKIG